MRTSQCLLTKLSLVAAIAIATCSPLYAASMHTYSIRINAAAIPDEKFEFISALKKVEPYIKYDGSETGRTSGSEVAPDNVAITRQLFGTSVEVDNNGKTVSSTEDDEESDPLRAVVVALAELVTLVEQVHGRAPAVWGGFDDLSSATNPRMIVFVRSLDGTTWLQGRLYCSEELKNSIEEAAIPGLFGFVEWDDLVEDDVAGLRGSNARELSTSCKPELITHDLRGLKGTVYSSSNPKCIDLPNADKHAGVLYGAASPDWWFKIEIPEGAETLTVTTCHPETDYNTILRIMSMCPKEGLIQADNVAYNNEYRKKEQCLLIEGRSWNVAYLSYIRLTGLDGVKTYRENGRRYLYGFVEAFNGEGGLFKLSWEVTMPNSRRALADANPPKPSIPLPLLCGSRWDTRGDRGCLKRPIVHDLHGTNGAVLSATKADCFDVKNAADHLGDIIYINERSKEWWFKLRVPHSARKLRITTCNKETKFDTQLALFATCPYEGMTRLDAIAFNDNYLWKGSDRCHIISKRQGQDYKVALLSYIELDLDEVSFFYDGNDRYLFGNVASEDQFKPDGGVFQLEYDFIMKSDSGTPPFPKAPYPPQLPVLLKCDDLVGWNPSPSSTPKVTPSPLSTPTATPTPLTTPTASPEPSSKVPEASPKPRDDVTFLVHADVEMKFKNKQDASDARGKIPGELNKILKQVSSLDSSARRLVNVFPIPQPLTEPRIRGHSWMFDSTDTKSGDGRNFEASGDVSKGQETCNKEDTSCSDCTIVKVKTTYLVSGSIVHPNGETISFAGNSKFQQDFTDQYVHVLLFGTSATPEDDDYASKALADAFKSADSVCATFSGETAKTEAKSSDNSSGSIAIVLAAIGGALVAVGVIVGAAVAYKKRADRKASRASTAAAATTAASEGSRRTRNESSRHRSRSRGHSQGRSHSRH